MTDYERERLLSEIGLAMLSIESGTLIGKNEATRIAHIAALATGRTWMPYFHGPEEALAYTALAAVEMQLKGRGNGY